MSPLFNSRHNAISHLKSDPHIPKEVPEMLNALFASIQTALDDNLLAMYLRGSLATGDFDPKTSDIDFFVITKHQPGDTGFATLAAMHDQLAKLPNRYARHLEGTYIDHTAVRRFSPGEHFPTIMRQEQLVWYEHDYNWILERWMIREQGIILCGPEPVTLIDPISSDDLRTAVRLRLPSWVEWANQPDDPAWQLPRNHKAYAIETMCRALCTLATGTLQSKPRAVTWALATLPDPWRTSVERSQKWHADETIDPGINPEVMRFIRWAALQGG